MAIKRPGEAASDRAADVFDKLKPSELITMSLRLPESAALKIQAEARRLGLKPGQLLRSWIMERLND